MRVRRPGRRARHVVERAAVGLVPVRHGARRDVDPALVEEVGRALGREAHSKIAHVLLAPTVNLHRTPIGGRNFECLSEDPVLTAALAVAYVRGRAVARASPAASSTSSATTPSSSG